MKFTAEQRKTSSRTRRRYSLHVTHARTYATLSVADSPKFLREYISTLVFAAATRQVDERMAQLYSVVHEDPVACRRLKISVESHKER